MQVVVSSSLVASRRLSHVTKSLLSAAPLALWYGTSVVVGASFSLSPWRPKLTLAHTCSQMRVKKLFRKPDTALVQFRNPTDAQRALPMLNGCPWGAGRLSAKPSNKIHVELQRVRHMHARFLSHTLARTLWIP